MDVQIAQFFSTEKMYKLENVEEKIVIYKKMLSAWGEVPIEKFVQLIEEKKDIDVRVNTINQSLYVEGKFKEYIEFNKKNLNFPHIVERNQLWLPRIKKLHTELESPAVFRGAFLHWVGEKGILNSLYKEGFKIRVMDADTKTFQPFNIREALVEPKLGECIIS